MAVWAIADLLFGIVYMPHNRTPLGEIANTNNKQNYLGAWIEFDSEKYPKVFGQ